ncbi:glycosyltransferase [Roseivivax sp.]
MAFQTAPGPITLAPKSDQTPPYFHAFRDRTSPPSTTFDGLHRELWHTSAGITLGLGIWYLTWRWGHSFNPNALTFSIAVATAETLALTGSLLFFFDIWDETDTPPAPPPTRRAEAGLEGRGPIHIDFFLTTRNEPTEVVSPSLVAARSVIAPPGTRITVHLLDDGSSLAMRHLAPAMGVQYHARETRRGFKAGNLTHALFASEGDFVVICDADTQLFPSFLTNTLGYFRDPSVAFVQTPHWFYDIPDGIPWPDWLEARFGRKARRFAPCLSALTGRPRQGADPFLSDPGLFFDVIQRRRNRHGAAFCCGAASIHRREALFQNALLEQGRRLTRLARKGDPDSARALLPRLDLMPFRYHVSEDLFTAFEQHANGWRSVYHPGIEARMLSPWTMDAWATQKLKYAGGTFDIFLRSGLIFRRGLPWATRLHYLATFWSYLSALWLPVLLLAPVVSLFTGLAPVDAYSLEFFQHLLPLLIMNELAMSLAAKGHNIHAGRILAIATLGLQWRALWQVLRGQPPHFPTTPKLPSLAPRLRHMAPNLALLALMILAAIHGTWAYLTGIEGFSASFLAVNLFWLTLNAAALMRAVSAGFWRPPAPHTAQRSSANAT